MTELNPYASPEATDMIEEVEIYQPHIFALDGRIGRLRYLAYSFVLNLIVFVPIGVIFAFLGAATGESLEDPTAGASMLLIGVLYIVMFAIAFILMRRRLNDLDHSGWWSLLMFVPLVNMVLGLYLLFAPGTNGINRFGPQPDKNTIGVILLGLLFPLVFVVGMLAAVAIPAYQDYTQRAESSSRIDMP